MDLPESLPESLSEPLSEQAFAAYIDKVQMLFDSMVEEGSDQELFISGYLNGHFSLISSVCFNAQELSVAQLDGRMRESLQQAFENDELQSADQEQVMAFWQRCLALA